MDILILAHEETAQAYDPALAALAVAVVVLLVLLLVGALARRRR